MHSEVCMPAMLMVAVKHCICEVKRQLQYAKHANLVYRHRRHGRASSKVRLFRTAVLVTLGGLTHKVVVGSFAR